MYVQFVEGGLDLGVEEGMDEFSGVLHVVLVLCRGEECAQLQASFTIFL